MGGVGQGEVRRSSDLLCVCVFSVVKLVGVF